MHDLKQPASIRIMGQTFKVKSVKNLKVAIESINPADVDHEWVHEGGMDVLGTCDRDGQTIEVETEGIGFDKRRETLLHESLHALIAMTGLSKDALDDREENVVNRLAPALLQFIRDNPTLYSYLTGRYTYR